MRISTLLTLFILTCITQKVFSQVPQEDVVYMNNGSFLRGKIVEMHPGESLRMVYAGKDTITILMSDVKIIKKENVPEETNMNFDKGVRSWGYTCIIEITYGQGLLEGVDWKKDTAESEYSVMLSVSNGLTLSPHIYLGIGVGFEVWRARKFIPVYLDFRSCFLKTANSPFLYFNLGYSAGWMENNSQPEFGGAMAGIGAGGRFAITRNKSIVVSLGYRFQQTREWDLNNNVEVRGTRDAHFISFKAGLIF